MDPPMRIPVGVHSSATVKQRGDFRCPRCQHWQRAEVVGVGGGAASPLFGADLARERARASASRNAGRILRFATCPKCGKRSGRGAYAARQAQMVLVMTALMFVLGYLWPVFDHSLDAEDIAFCHTWFPLLMVGILALVVPFTAIGEWRKIDRRVRWLEL